jgi:hypothetical protein
MKIFFDEHLTAIKHISTTLHTKKFTKTLLTHELDISTEKDLYKSFSSILQPFNTTGNGDCLWNMVSICLCGNESLSRNLRWLSVLTLLLFKSEFLNLLLKRYISVETGYPDAFSRIKYEQILRIAIDSGNWGNEYHLLALSTFLDKKIFIYSSFKKMTGFFWMKQ